MGFIQRLFISVMGSALLDSVWDLAAIKEGTMTENQLIKLKNRLLNIQTQLAGASVLLERTDPFINSKITQANKLVQEAFTMSSTIKTVEDNSPSKKKHKKQDHSSPLVPHHVIVSRNEPPTYNRLCRNYSEIRNRQNEVIERTCVVGMDMCYCSKKCAYATNNVCSLRG